MNVPLVVRLKVDQCMISALTQVFVLYCPSVIFIPTNFSSDCNTLFISSKVDDVIMVARKGTLSFRIRFVPKSENQRQAPDRATSFSESNA